MSPLWHFEDHKVQTSLVSRRPLQQGGDFGGTLYRGLAVLLFTATRVAKICPQYRTKMRNDDTKHVILKMTSEVFLPPVNRFLAVLSS